MLSRFKLYAILLILVLAGSLVYYANTPSFWLILALLVFSSSKFLPEFAGCRWVPSRTTAVKKMLDIANLKPGDCVYDLGSGDGRIIIGAAKRDAHAIGIEIDPLKCILTWLRIKKNKLTNAKIKWGNFFKVDFKDADVVFLYLLPETLQKMEKSLKKLKKGSRIVSHGFKFNGLKQIKSLEKEQIYLYKI